MTLITKAKFELLDRYKELNVGKSMTVPNETLTVRQIMEKHVHGMRVADTLARQPLYDEDVDFDSQDMEKVRQMDFVEVENLHRATKAHVQEIKDEAKREQARRKSVEDEAKRKDEKADEPSDVSAS